jgi:hypothetical protein
MKSPDKKVHKNSSSKGSQSQVKSNPGIEYAGKTVLSNYWVKIGFSRQELGALREIAKIFKHSYFKTTGHAAAVVLTTALMHWEKLEPLLRGDFSSRHDRSKIQPGRQTLKGSRIQNYDNAI